MAVQENIAGAERRQVRGVVDVAVRGVDQPVSNREDAVIGQNREGCTDFTGIFGEFVPLCWVCREYILFIQSQCFT